MQELCKMTLITKTARRLKELKDYIDNHKHFANLVTNEMIRELIDFKNELKEIHKEIEKGYIGDNLFRTKIKNFIKEIEEVENAKNK